MDIRHQIKLLRQFKIDHPIVFISIANKVSTAFFKYNSNVVPRQTTRLCSLATAMAAP